jgi:3-oxoacyl-[acyl-carrier protein] reductase
MDLEGRVAIVTGGGTGLGAEVSRQLATAGVRVAVNYSRSADAAQELVATLPTAAVAVRADVRNEDDVRHMVHEVERALEGPVEVLVNNAGVTTYVPAPDLDPISDEGSISSGGCGGLGARTKPMSVLGDRGGSSFRSPGLDRSNVAHIWIT